MKNTLTDLNNYLFEEMERLTDDALTEDQLEREISRADAIIKVSQTVISNAEMAFKVIRHTDEYGYSDRGRALPPMLEAGNK